MYTSHAFESEPMGRFSPPKEALEISDISEDGVDRLHSGCSGGIDEALTRVKRFIASGGFDHTQVGRVILQADCQSNDLIAARGDGKCVFDSQCGLQDGHKPDRASDAILGLDL